MFGLLSKRELKSKKIIIEAIDIKWVLSTYSKELNPKQELFKQHGKNDKENIKII
jgi:hypothetical protein